MRGAIATRPIQPSEIITAGGSYSPEVAVLFGPDGQRLQPTDFSGSPTGFGPMAPLVPRLTEPNLEPREYQYVPGWNLLPIPRAESAEFVRFNTLRLLVKNCYYARIAIEYRKKQLRGMKWSIVAKEDAKSKAAAEKHADAIKAVEAFFRKPNRRDDMGFSAWIGQALEEVYVTDACVFYKRPRRDGGLFDLIQIDGATIKVVLDEFAAVVGYQQILYGYPNTQYPRVVGEYEKNALAYLVFNPRVDSTYGTSPIEEIQPIIEVAILRTLNQRGWYTEGNIPTAVLQAPLDWSPQQIQLMQNYYDDMFAGDETQRHRVRLIPGGGTLQQLKPFQFSKDEDDAVASAVCAHFGISRNVLINEMNRATAQVGQQDAVEVGLKPILNFLTDFFNEIIAEGLQEPDVVFAWVEENDGKDRQRAERVTMLVDKNVLTRDEARKEYGLDPLDTEKDATLDPAKITGPVLSAGAITVDEVRTAFGLGPIPGGDRLIAVGAFGTITPEAAEAAAEEGPAKGPALGVGGPATPSGGGAPPEPRPAPAGAATGRPGPQAPEAPEAPEHPAVAAEKAAWKRFARKRVGKSSAKRFVASAIPAYEAAVIAHKLRKAKDDAGVDAAFVKAKKRLTDAAKQRHEAALKSAFASYLAAQKRAALAGMKSAKADDGLAALLKAVKEQLADIFSAAAQDVAEEWGDGALDFDFLDERVRAFADKHAGDLVTQVDRTTKREIGKLAKTALEEGWSSDRLASALEESFAFSEGRAERIARTELGLAQNTGQAASMKAMGFRKVHVLDGDCDVCIEIDGEEWDVDEAIARPLEHPNCVRSFVPVTDSLED